MKQGVCLLRGEVEAGLGVESPGQDWGCEHVAPVPALFCPGKPLTESLQASGQAAAQNSGKPGFRMLQLSAEAAPP